MSPLGCHILGAGSIGLLTAWHLRHAGIPVTLLLRRQATAHHMSQHGNKLQLEFAGASITGWPDWLEGYPSGSVPAYDMDVELLHKGGGWAASTCSSSSMSGINGAASVQASSNAGSGHSNGGTSVSHEQTRLLPPIHRLIVATKATDTVPALLSVLGRLSPGCQVLLLQNGILGVYQEVHQKVLSLPQAPPALSVLLGSVTHGAYLTSPSHVVHSGMGAIKLAPVDASLPTLTDPGHQAARDRLGLKDQQLAASHCSMPPAVAHGCSAAGMSEGGTAGAGGETSGGRVGQDLVQARAGGSCLLQQLLGVRSLATELVPDHHSFMQQVHMKLAVNCAVNPFTALLGCLNHTYSDNPHGQELAVAVCNELFELYGPQLLGRSSGKELAEFVLQVASSTGKNKNSMLQDVLAGRPTEIDYLNGYVARWAEQQGRQAPLNKLICSLVRAKETMGKGLM